MRFGIRELIFLVILVAVPAVSMFFVFKPRNAEIKQALDEINSKQAQLARLDAVAERIDDLGIEIERGREAIRTIEEKLPSQQGVETILQQVWEIAAAKNLVVKSFKSEKPISSAQYGEQPLKIEMNGNFNGFYRFMIELENLPRITQVRDLSLERLDSGLASTTNAEMTAKFTLSIYYESGSGSGAVASAN